MIGTGIRTLTLAALTAAFGSLGTACYVEDDVPPPGYAEVGYEPMYYDGNLVFYDDVGRPYYYAGDAVVWVPPSAPIYGTLVAHWRVYGPAYHRWYRGYGYRYHGYVRRGWRR